METKNEEYEDHVAMVIPTHVKQLGRNVYTLTMMLRVHKDHTLDFFIKATYKDQLTIQINDDIMNNCFCVKIEPVSTKKAKNKIVREYNFSLEPFDTPLKLYHASSNGKHKFYFIQSDKFDKKKQVVSVECNGDAVQRTATFKVTLADKGSQEYKAPPELIGCVADHHNKMKGTTKWKWSKGCEMKNA